VRLGKGEDGTMARSKQGSRRAVQRQQDTAHFSYVYFWNRAGRKGQPCKVTARGKMNSCRVQFEDGFVMITSWNAIRKSRPA
jgi:hypothetical protein